MSQFKNNIKPFFLFAHTCMLHIPLNLPYPFYQNTLGINYSYPSVFHANHYWDSVELIQNNKNFLKLYESGVQRLTVEFLNPFFEKYYSLKDKPFKIILISDHGENFWLKNEKPIPIVKIPFHGHTLLFGSTSEYAYFRYMTQSIASIPIQIKGPKDPIESQVEGVINLSQALRFSLGLNYNQDIVTSETGHKILIKSKSLIKYVDSKMQSRNLNVDTYRDDIYVNNNINQPAVLEKDRSVYLDKFKLTYYKTIYGPRYFLCDTEYDPSCTLNLYYTNEKIKDQLLQKLVQSLKPDIVNQLELDITKKIEDLVLNSSSVSNGWLKLYLNQIEYHSFRNFINADHLLIDQYFSESNKDLKLEIADELMSRCFHLSEKKKRFYIHYVPTLLKNQESNDLYKLKSKLFKCQSIANRIMNKNIFPENFSKEYINLYQWKNEYDIDVFNYIQDLSHRYNINYLNNIFDLFLKIPDKFLSKEINLFFIFLDNQTINFRNYGLPNDLDPYYFLKYLLINKFTQDFRSLVREVTQYPGSTFFETLFFNKMISLNKIDITDKQLQNEFNKRKLIIENLNSHF